MPEKNDSYNDALMRSILETALDCIITMDHHGNIVEFNPAAERTFGYARADVIGKELARMIIPPGVRERHARGLAHFLATGEAPVLGKRLEILAMRANGSEFMAELAITQLPSADAPLFTAYLRDITERLKVQQQRAARLAVTQALTQLAGVREVSRAVLEAICLNLDWEVASFWSFATDASHLVCVQSWHKPDFLSEKFKDLNRQLQFVKGQGLPGRVWSSAKADWIKEIRTDTNFPRLSAAVEAGLHSGFAYPVVADGKVIGVFEFFSRDMRDPDSDLLEMMNTLAGNFGQYIKRQTTEEQLRQSEQKLQLLADTIPQLAWMAQPDGHIFWYNRRWYDYTGTTLEQMQGWGWQSVHHEDHLPRVLEGWKASIATGAPFDMIFPLRGADGSFRAFLTRINPLRDEQGRITYWFGTNTDIEEQQRANAELARSEERYRQLAAELREGDRRKDEFLATLAHELRNPLAPISNSLQLLKIPNVDATTKENARDVMERQLKHLVRLVDDLLDVSRVTAGKIELQVESVDLRNIVVRAVEIVQPVLDSRGQQLRVQMPEQPLAVDGDPVRLAQVIANILANAGKYSEQGKPIAVSSQLEGDSAVLRIRDLGIGIDPSMLSRIFDVFVQADQATTKAQGGLGLGLTLAKNIVEMHSGTIEAHSDGLGKGSEFVVRLPLSHKNFPDKPNASADSALKAETFYALRLLVVDDNQDAAVSLAMLLQKQGHKVEVAHSGARALEITHSYVPDLVFLDIGMPVMDGFETARRLRQQPGLETVVIVAVTGWGQQEDRARSAAAGFNHHIVKPPEIATLQELLAGLKK